MNSQLDMNDEIKEQYALIQNGFKPKRWPGDEGEEYFYFSLHAPNNEIIAQSEQYMGGGAHRNIVELLDKYFYNFRVVDTTSD